MPGKPVVNTSIEIQEFCAFWEDMLSYLFATTFCQTKQVNVVSYKSRPNAKDFIQVEIVVEKNSQKIILIGKVITFSMHRCTLYFNLYIVCSADLELMEMQ